MHELICIKDRSEEEGPPSSESAAKDRSFYLGNLDPMSVQCSTSFALHSVRGVRHASSPLKGCRKRDHTFLLRFISKRRHTHGRKKNFAILPPKGGLAGRDSDDEACGKAAILFFLFLPALPCCAR